TFMNMGICKFLYIFITRSFIVIAQPFKYRRVQWEKAHPKAPVSCVLVRTPYPCFPVPIFAWDQRPSDLLVDHKSILGSSVEYGDDDDRGTDVYRPTDNLFSIYPNKALTIIIFVNLINSN